MKPETRQRLQRTAILSALALVIGAGMGFYQVKNQTAQVVNVGAQAGSETVPGTQVGGPYALTDHNGKPVTEKDFTAPYKLIYFGFTYCPAICPTELQKITQAMKLLGDEASQVQPIFITIDPERDTVDVMREYVKLFDPRLVGLTGTRAQIDEALKNYRVFAKKVQNEDDTDYTMDHSSFIYLMNANNELISIYRTEDGADMIAADIRAKTT